MFALYTTIMKKIILLLCIFQFSLNYSQTSHQAASKTTINHISHDSISSINHPSCIIKGLEIPQTHQYELIISHLGYTLSFNKAHKQANWVAYEYHKRLSEAYVNDVSLLDTLTEKLENDLIPNTERIADEGEEDMKEMYIERLQRAWDKMGYDK